MPRDGRRKKSQNIVLVTEQRAILDLISARTLGNPGLSGLIRHALDTFIDDQLRKNPELELEVAKLRASANSNVVPIRAVPSVDHGGK